MLGKIEGRRRRGRQRISRLGGITDSTGMNLSKPGVLQSVRLQRAGHNGVAEQQQQQKSRFQLATHPAWHVTWCALHIS